jgi:hypothetical protein
MVTRVRIDADGASAAEVERVLLAVAAALEERYSWLASGGEQVIERQLAEPGGFTAFHGRLTLHPNVASDSGQVAALAAQGVVVSLPAWSADDAVAVGGVPYGTVPPDELPAR